MSFIGSLIREQNCQIPSVVDRTESNLFGIWFVSVWYFYEIPNRISIYTGQKKFFQRTTEVFSFLAHCEEPFLYLWLN